MFAFSVEKIDFYRQKLIVPKSSFQTATLKPNK
jgi:hypothetical protein